MSHDRVILDLEAIKERYNLFNSTFPSEALKHHFEFDFSSSATENLIKLSQIALNDKHTSAYLFIYNTIFLEILAHWTTKLDKNESVKVLESSSRIITMYPKATSLIEEFLERENDHFVTILQNPSSQDENQIFTILLSYFRLLYHNKDIFESFIKPDVLYKLISSSQPSELTKFIALKVLGIFLDAGEAALTSMFDIHITSDGTLIGTYELDNNINYKFLEINEAKRFSNFTRLPEVPEVHELLPNKKYFLIEPTELNDRVVSICGVLVPRGNSIRDIKQYPLTFVPTEKTIATLRLLARKVQNSEPVMLVGQAGSGKTFIINELSKYMQCHDSIVKIHLGEQTDAKLLLGTYTSGEKPGTFEWRSGVLTTAVKEGRWVLIEDIDKAPTEVLSILLSLLEKREMTIPSRGETVKAANGFQLISTVRLSEDTIKENKEENNFNLNIIGLRIWSAIHLIEPTIDDLKEILCQRYPVLSQLIPKLIRSYEGVKAIYGDPRFISLNRGAHARIVSTRDLMKLCNRLQALFTNNNIIKPDQLIESSIYDSIFAEAADCFTAAISEFKALQPLIYSIGESLEIAESRISLFIDKHVPQLEELDDNLKIGRATLQRSPLSIQRKSVNSTSFATTNHSLRLMEQIAVAVQMTEPVLLVGETGTGKTTVVQQVAKLMNKKLTVINVSQQTEAGDLLGGYKPVNSKTVAVPVQETFETLFAVTFSLKKNEKFYKMLHKCFNKNQWKNVVKLWTEAYKMAQTLLNKESMADVQDQAKEKKRRLNLDEKKVLLGQWEEFHAMVEKFELQSASIENAFIFNFVEGSLVKAVRNGEWLLLDEVNLASADTLENISDLLTESDSRSILLSEKGDAEPIKAHPDFRIFACMNPATDVGKRDLPSGIRSRFTEIYVNSPDRDITDLLSIIDKYIGKFSVSDEWVGNDIAELYLKAKKLSENSQIVDGSNQKAHFSIRTLTRTLLYACDIVHIYGLRRALYDGFCMSFLTLLDQTSEKLLLPIIEEYTLGRLKNARSVLSQVPPSPGLDYVQFKHYWMEKGHEQLIAQPHYIITPFVEKNMLNLVRATFSKRFPILIQGPTSAGKTSMIKYLADITGHKFVRINNHEHTDLQEYLGTYVADDTGKLCFREGVLVEALRKGYWIVLDELNLAPTDVLEALNRLLDDNRELFIPETQEVVHPHPNFMLFATQNPPGLYGGRKVLSRAFRNRFLELHFDDIPQDELEIILRERCQIAPTYAKKIVEVYRQLSIERSASRIFEKKNSFATLRDLFRWALRDAVGYEQLASNGYMLLAERCRNPQEKITVKRVLEKVMKVKLDMDTYYASLEDKELESQDSVIWTKGLRRLAVLVSSCLKNNEPVLLVGETGCGKTTICQLLASFLGKQLITLNAHQNTETGDILGAQRPVRNKAEVQTKLIHLLQDLLQEHHEKDLNTLLEKFKNFDKSAISTEDLSSVKTLQDNMNALFEWCDGPLIHALKTGNLFLLDEISLADDSVLERLNSVLEPERSLLLAEKGTSDSLICAEPGFQFLATMNPGGDYGKKELSPALRNRFTEIWVPSMENFNDVSLIVQSRLKTELKHLEKAIVSFSEWFGKKFGGGDATNGIISLRDILAWVEFVNSTYDGTSNEYTLLVHGASMVFVDTLGTNNTAYLAEDEENLNKLKRECIKQLSKFACQDLTPSIQSEFALEVVENSIQIGPFKLSRYNKNGQAASFNMRAPTTSSNLMRVVRALQVHKPVLLEGSPGVGKTSLITALAELTGNSLTRINLSEQTDLIDLFGSDVPGEKSGEFVWQDAPFLRAMQQGHWVLLDEMNLASQSVLEGLNACLDHRGEAYIPELDRSFACHPNFLVFAAQNPQYQGGGRKGLPKSFVNRFTVVYVDMLKTEDLLLISQHLYPNMEAELSGKMIQIMSVLEEEVSKKKKWGTLGAPWEFNLRDALRWLKLLTKASISSEMDVLDFVDIIVKQRFRTEKDKDQAESIINAIFGAYQKNENYHSITADYVQFNREISARNPLYHFSTTDRLIPLECNISVYESALRCINNNWPLILVGPSNSGKTSIVTYLASIVGQKVSIFSMNSDVDSMDIIGGYEQVDMVRKISFIIDELKPLLREILTKKLMEHGQHYDVLTIGLELLQFINQNIITAKTYSLFEMAFQQFYSTLQDNACLSKIASEIVALSKIVETDVSVKFEWFNGMLVKAVEQGHWLVLDNANLCSPSVLDRLNSLLETNGTLLINECSQENGEPRILKPHPNFRLFLTMDPKYGELSRAMRNRGIEVFVDNLKERASSFDALSLGYKCNKETRGRAEIDQYFGSLHLNNLKEKRPLKNFIPAHISAFQSFSKIHDVILNSRGSISVESLLGILPINELSEVQQWVTNISNNRSFEQTALLEHMNEILNFLVENKIVHRINDISLVSESNIYSIIDKAQDNLSTQPLFPLLNVYVLPMIEKISKNICSPEPLYLFASARVLLNSIDTLKQINLRSLQGKLTELSYIELSAAATNGRQVKLVPRIPIFSFLCKLVDQLLYSFSNIPLFEQTKTYQEFWNLLTVIESALETASLKDEARLRVYKELFEEWCNIARSEGLQVTEFSEICRAFEDTLRLQRGQSITLLWEAFRGKYPSTRHAWNVLTEVAALSDKFDKVRKCQFAESYASIATLTEFFRTIFDDTLKDESNVNRDIISTLEKGIDELQTISSKFLRKRKHFFMKEFDNLLRLLYHSRDVPQDLFIGLGALSSMSTRQMIKYSNEEHVYPPIFDLLWVESDGAYQSFVTSLFTSQYFESIISKSNQFGDFSGGHIQQTLLDAKLLLSSTIKSSKFILNDQSAVSGSILMKWINRIVSIHTKLDIDVIPLEKVRSIVLESTESYFSEVFQNYLLPAIELCSDVQSMASLGKAWILFGVSLITLYAPDVPYDPALHDYVIHDIFSKQKTYSDELANTWIAIREVINGDQNMFTERFIKTVHATDAPAKPKIYRPDESVDSLFDEWSAFLVSTVSKDQVFSLLSATDTWNRMTEGRFDMFQQNTSNFLRRLEGAHMFFADLNDIFAGYVLSVKFGFELLKQSKTEMLKETDISSLWSINPLILSSTELINECFNELIEYSKKAKVDNTSTENILLFFMQLFKAHKNDISLLPCFDATLQSLYSRWSIRRMRAEKESESQERTFKYEGTNDDFEAGLRELFPDYEESLDFDEHASSDPESEMHLMYYAISRQYTDTFNDEAQDDFTDILKKGSKIANLLVSESKKFKSHKLDNSHLTAVLNILSNEIASFEQNPDMKKLDFYRDSSVFESQKAASVIDSIWKIVYGYLNEWPEHATLNELSRICEEFLEYPASTPIYKQLQKLEQVYTFMAEWERYASSQVSLGNCIRDITDLIVSWRRLELHTWNGLFNSEDEKLKQKTGKWWFYLYETIIAANAAKPDTILIENNTQLVSSLNIFFSKSTYGEFVSRLELVEAFSKHLQLLNLSQSAVAHILNNVISFYGQFKPLILETLKNGRKALDKEMSEVILLASWKDVNIDALKESSRRSHNSLYKIVRKYRDVLSTAVQPLIEGGLSFIPGQKVVLQPLGLGSFPEFDLAAAKEMVIAIPGWDSRSSVLQNVDIVESNMNVYMTKLSNQKYPSLEVLAKEFGREADRLRDETPNVYSKDKKKLLASLRTQKSKLLSDALKELKRIGLKTNFREDIRKVQSTTSSILTNSVSFSLSSLQGSDLYFFKLLELLPRLRASAGNPAEDIPVLTIERGMAIAENLVFSLITTRAPLYELSQSYYSIKELRGSLENLCCSKGFIKPFSLNFSVNKLKHFCGWLPELINYALHTLAIIETSSAEQIDTTYLLEAKQTLNSFHSKMTNVKTLDSNASFLVSEFENFMINFIAKLNERRAPNTFFVYDTLLKWIYDHNISNTDFTNQLEEVKLQDIDQAFRKVYTSVVLSFQKLMELGYESVEESEDKWLQTTSKQLMKYVKILTSSSVLKNLEAASQLLDENDISSSKADFVRAIVTFTLPVINKYFMTTRCILEKVRSYYVTTSHGTYILSNILLNLAKNGLCSPEPPSEEVEDNNLHEGTGLGDGEGAQNNSKDIEQDEDLTEDAQTANKDQKEKDEFDEEDEKDDAVEMEGDMAGEMEEASDQEDKDDDDELDDEDELDKQIDNIDDDDPNAIDEKMWNEEAEDDSKEKNSDKNLDSKNDDEDIQASENKNDDDDLNKEKDQEGTNEESNAPDGPEEQGEDQEDQEDQNSADEENDVGEQEDEVRADDEGQELDTNVPETETMDLPDVMDLDGGSEDDEEENGSENIEDNESPDESDDNLDNTEANDISDVEQQNEDMESEEMTEQEGLEMDQDENSNDMEDQEMNPDDVTENEDHDMENTNDSEEELDEGKFDEHQKADEDQENNAEGLAGIGNGIDEENVDTDAATQQQSGSKGEGADAKDVEEQEDIGASGETMNTYQDDKENNDEQDTNESSRQEAKEALKQLGDSLKEYHRRRQEIKEATNNEDEKTQEPLASQRPDEFEHAEGANTENDTQALGAASKEQLQTVDEDMAIDDDEDRMNDKDLNEKEDYEMVDEESVVEEKENELEETSEADNAGQNNLNKGVFAGVGRETEEDLLDPNNNNTLKNNAYEDELDELMDKIDLDAKENEINEEAPTRTIEESRDIWRKSEISTADLVSRLGEQLRLILEPTLATKLRGDYKTGKRLNMKRIIPYIASQFRKDKIWLRRTKPSKRQYQIMIALDNSKSMSESKCVKLAFDSLCLVSKTLSQLESGGLSIVKFGEHFREVHKFDQQFSNESGAKAFQWFDFKDTKTDVERLVAESIKIFERGRLLGNNNSDQWQLEIIISDGICENHETIKRLVRRAREKKIMLVFVIIDGISSNESIMDMNQVTYVPDQYGNQQLKINKYLDSFPFEFYVVVHDISELPEMLSLILRQYFTDLASS
ncbi:hypothetical protein KAFR_0B02920 [Kazachstania africana CBS 2517]|uniref:Midasin n=1 Tax=Kazachstania africana (strain ATCC 22294 / BCRC 22015 / CBS 2517 / CECT 1963 / NBRC 1671 / NRRL Y-8276) TaxID=1071382 RepID=H2AQD9_KAZAF|nr:hypothetical protein KAFR_0B02920 [Kazachstania africana CBS 2517]CCF56589.1 hypothetical protein KAFR_0B02920 [Kazachstania africana CBS 2517]